jgi:hypothetical protein
MRVECQFEPWLQEMFSALDFMARDGRWGAINSFLAEQGAGDHPGYPIAILRFTYTWPKDRLTEWGPLLERTHADLLHRGFDADKLLRGLTDK